MRTNGNGNQNRDVRIVNWPHFHGFGEERKEHAHLFDVRDEKHIAAASVNHYALEATP